MDYTHIIGRDAKDVMQVRQLQKAAELLEATGFVILLQGWWHAEGCDSVRFTDQHYVVMGPGGKWASVMTNIDGNDVALRFYPDADNKLPFHVRMYV